MFASHLRALAALLLVLAWPAITRAETVILAFGDSLTAGQGLRQDQSFPAQLERWLRRNGADVRVVNGGVSGETTAGGRARIAAALTPEIDAVIVELGGNDLLRKLSPRGARENLDAILSEIARQDLPVLLAGLISPPNYGADYKRQWDRIYPSLARKHDAILYPSFLDPVAKDKNLFQIAALFQSDGLHPNARGVALIVEDIGPDVLRLIAEAD
jgi:acyl-CoA thioesterase I